ncbi:DUF4340 domain-containing protein [sulfur-oxidizing endosymbiont of Gigantopelta aegis]|uniref:DUF4340 domain-containing protein n=1 Tax=sulfur-oxidizing endosymbiont of Gigantopelta aegis TaxID=2794934 RepID=UPI0018DDEBF5|nr:DUF4340 domain-containing protein [sulfur-oxidizing endosymbiont of Gigantopelta aegis]
MSVAILSSKLARTNIILLLIVIGLSLIAWFQPGLKTTVLHYLSDLKSAEINTIIIERKDLDSIKLSKKKSGWYLQEPYYLPANPLRVNTVLALAEKRSYTQFQSSEQDLSRYQLDKPLISVWLNETQLILGSDDPIKKQRYAMNITANINTGDNNVHLINAAIFYQLRANLDSFVSPHLLPPQAKLTRIEWSDKQLQIKEGKWVLTPDLPDTSSDSIVQLIQFWQHAQARRVETHVNLSLTNAELLNSPRIIIRYELAENNANPAKSGAIQYLIIQEDKQIKLLRTDLQIAYWISAKTLKQLSEFLPLSP